MRIKQWLTAFLILLHFSASAGEIVLSGVYQGKNLFVQNPLSANKTDFCTNEVWVNEQKKMSQIRSSAFEIDLSFLNMYDSVTVRIIYKEDCMPKVLNASVLRPNTTFQFVSFQTKGDSLQWTVMGESNVHSYYVQQFVNEHWVDLQMIRAKGVGSNLYFFPLTQTDKPKRYRIKMQDQKTHQMYYSEELTYVTRKEKDYISFFPKSVSSKITLSGEAAYEVRSTDGKVVKKGRGTEIPLAELKSGVYYLNLNNSQTEKFFKK